MKIERLKRIEELVERTLDKYRKDPQKREEKADADFLYKSGEIMAAHFSALVKLADAAATLSQCDSYNCTPEWLAMEEALDELESFGE